MTAPLPAPERKSLTEWTESDDSDFSTPDVPHCTAAQRQLHAIVAGDHQRRDDGDAVERLAPPPGFALAPLG